jgi:hypothetical protein
LIFSQTMHEIFKKYIVETEKLLNEYPKFKLILKLIVYYYTSYWISALIIVPFLSILISIVTGLFVKLSFSNGLDFCYKYGVFPFKSTNPVVDCPNDAYKVFETDYRVLTGLTQIFWQIVLLVYFLFSK